MQFFVRMDLYENCMTSIFAQPGEPIIPWIIFLFPEL